MRLALTAPRTVRARYLGPIGCCGWHADATVTFEPIPERACLFVNAVTTDVLPAEYAAAFAEGVLLGLAGSREDAEFTTRAGIPRVRFLTEAVNAYGAIAVPEPHVAVGEGVRAVLRGARFHPTDANERGYRGAGWLAVLAAAEGESQVLYRG